MRDGMAALTALITAAAPAHGLTFRINGEAAPRDQTAGALFEVTIGEGRNGHASLLRRPRPSEGGATPLNMPDVRLDGRGALPVGTALWVGQWMRWLRAIADREALLVERGHAAGDGPAWSLEGCPVPCWICRSRGVDPVALFEDLTWTSTQEGFVAQADHPAFIIDQWSSRWQDPTKAWLERRAGTLVWRKVAFDGDPGGGSGSISYEHSWGKAPVLELVIKGTLPDTALAACAGRDLSTLVALAGAPMPTGVIIKDAAVITGVAPGLSRLIIRLHDPQPQPVTQYQGEIA